MAVVKPTPEARPAVERAKIEVPRPAPVTKAAKVMEEAARGQGAGGAAATLPCNCCGRALPVAGGTADRRTFPVPRPGLPVAQDMLRAAGLPDSPQIVGEPVRWPLLVRGTMDQGPGPHGISSGVCLGAPGRRALRVLCG